MKPEMPLFYHPTNTLFIDDDERFLRSLSLNIESQHCYSLCQNPEKAKELVNNYSYEKSFFDEYIKSDISYDTDIKTNDFLSLKFNTKCFNFNLSERFNKISTVILDYNMPKINGIELASEFRKNNSFIKIIMLTGKADSKVGLDAFNNKLINGFITKSTNGIDDYINKELDKIKLEYFVDLSEGFLSFIQTRKSTFLNKDFSDLLKSIIKEYKIVEYYVIDINGSLRLIDYSGDEYFIFVKSKSDLEAYALFAEDSNMSKEVINKIKLLEAMPVSTDKNIKQIAQVKDWDNLVPIKKIPGSTDHYYYFCANQGNQAEILSFKKFSQNIWPEY